MYQMDNALLSCFFLHHPSTRILMDGMYQMELAFIKCFIVHHPSTIIQSLGILVTQVIDIILAPFSFGIISQLLYMTFVVSSYVGLAPFSLSMYTSIGRWTN